MPTVAEVVRRYGPAVSRAVRRHDARGAQEGAARHRRLPHRRAGDGALPLPDPAARRTPWADRAATGIARAASTTRPRPGSRSRPTACCRAPTSWSPSRCRRSCATWPAAHQRVVYAALFEASSEAPAHPGGRPQVRRHGSAGLLRRAAHLGPDAGVSSARPLRRAGRRAQRRRRRWLPSRADFLVPVEALSILFRAKFRDMPAREGLLDQVDPSVWHRDWVVHSQAGRRRPGSRCGTWPRTSSGWRSATIGSSRATTAG